MPKNLDHLLNERRRRARQGRTGSFVVSALLHVALTAGFIFLPGLFEPPQRKLEFVSVMVVPPTALGIEQPPPPAPPRASPPPPEAAPPPAAPPPDVPVLPREEKTRKKEPAKTAVAPAPSPPARTERQRPPRRRGSPRGKPLGASTSNAALGAEDPNFTYGWYLDQLVRKITSNWTRPVVGSEIRAVFYFRIQRDGTITHLELREPSRLAEFDDAARRAIEASKLPPLPQAYKPDYLGITLLVE